MPDNELLLEVKGLRVHFFTDDGVVKAVDGVDFTLSKHQILGIVGESGCGKSVTAYGITQLIQKPGRIVDGEVLYHHDDGVVDLAKLNPKGRKIRSYRGTEISMIFQEPMNSLSPVHNIGFQITEALRWHQRVSKAEARSRAIELLRLVGIPKPELRVDDYTFQLSGGMRQRAMIAMALACNPRLLIADEPTTALDVTTQAQILELIQRLQHELGMAIMLITHDLGVVAETCQEVVVMYLGEVVEQADVVSLFHDPLHPYTQALLRSIPQLDDDDDMLERQRLDPIEGMVPSPAKRPAGCLFHNRCKEMIPGVCDRVPPRLVTMPDGRHVRCVLYDEQAT